MKIKITRWGFKKELISLLLKGVNAFNRYREKSNYVTLDWLTDAMWKDFNLAAADWKHANLVGDVNLVNDPKVTYRGLFCTKLKYANLVGTDLDGDLEVNK